MNNTYKTNKTDWRRRGRCFILAAVMLLGGMPAMAQYYYIFYNNSRGYIYNNGSNGGVTSTFAPSCIWRAGATLSTTSTTIYSYTENAKYMRGGNGSFSLGNSQNYWQLRDNVLAYRYTNSYHVYWTGSALSCARNQSGNGFTPTRIYIGSLSAKAPSLSITVSGGLTNGGIQLTPVVTGSYAPACDTAVVRGTTYYWIPPVTNSTEASETRPGIIDDWSDASVTWTVTTGGTYASVSSDGLVTLTGNPTGNIVVRMTVTKGGFTSNNTATITLTRANAAASTPSVTTLTTPTMSPATAKLYKDEDQAFTASATATKTTYTVPAHVTLTGGGNTYHYYDGTLYDGVEGFRSSEVTHPAVTLTWSLSGDASSYLTRTPTTGTSTTVTHSSQSPSDLSAILTVTATATDATPTTATATVWAYAPVAEPTITRTGNSISLATTSTGAKIYYTTDETTPTDESTEYTGPFDLTTSPTTVKAIAIRDVHSSTVATETFQMQLAAPVISISNTGLATITAEAGATIHYTTDGTTPTDGSRTYSAPVQLTNPQTIKAIAVKSDYITSDVAIGEFISSGTSGTNLVLDDREDHSWSYYSDATCPVRSLGPADVKITYYGNGTKTISTTNGATPASNSWTADATGVKVNVGGEDENCFIYYKTLERYNGETSDSYAYGSTAIYAYTTIPNPFQVRPTYSTGYGTGSNNKYTGFHAWRIKDIKNGKIYTAPAEGTLQGKWTSGNVNNTHILYAEHTYYFVPDGEYDMEVELEALWARAYVVECSTENGLSSAIASSTLQSTLSCERNFVVITNGSQVNEFTNASQKPVTISNLYPDGTGTVSNSKYVTGHFTANEDIKFENVYIRNRVTTSGYQYTRYTVYNTDGGSSYSYLRQGNNYVTATVSFPYRKTTTSVIETWVEGNTYYGYYYQNETQVNNITFDESMTYANTYNLTYGRGVQPYETYCANKLSGVSGSSNSNIDYTLRFESGTLGAIDLISDISYSFGGTVSTKCIIGCDYDRAKSDNTKLNIAPSSYIYGGNANQVFSSSSNRNNLTYDWLIKSGKVQKDLTIDDASAERAIYMGNSISGESGVQYNGRRRLTMEGGEVASIAGGVDCYGDDYADYGVTDGSWKLKIRIKGGTVRGSVYGAAAFGGSSNDRRFVFTGGEINGWVAGGANGTKYTGGALKGASYLYVGGNTSVNSNGNNTVINSAIGGNVFGAGCGFSNGSSSGQVYLGTTVVVADNAYVERGVYGGGAFGYCSTDQTSNVYILGGTVDGTDGGVTVASVSGDGDGATRSGVAYASTIKGGVYGGACQNQGGTVNLTMKGGTVNGSVFGGSNHTGVLAGGTTVNLYGGTINGSLYGGGNGTGSATDITEAVAVNVYGGTVTEAVYGCNNVSGAPQSTVNVDIYGTDPAPSADAYALGAVFGGGNQANYTAGTPVVTVHNCDNSIEYVYGGGNAAHITNGNTDVTIYGGNKIGNVFGGGNGTVTAANVSGSTNVKIYGGTIGRVFGGSNSQGSIGGTINVTVNKQAEAGHEACEMHVDEVYGGGNMAASAAGTIAIGCTGGETEGIGDVYGGANQANITGDITLNITGGRIRNVFGGNNTSGSISGLITVNINEGDDCPLTVDNVYGGGNLAAYAPTGSPTNAPVVNLIKGTVGLNDFDPEHPEGHGCVFGGGKGTGDNTVDDYINKGKVTANPKVRMYPANEGDMVVLNAIYGGGEIASVAGNTLVQIENGHVGSALKDEAEDNGFVFGAGKGYVGNYLLAQVTGNSTVTMSGGYVHNTLFGGGQMAMVGTYDLANAAYVSSHPTFVEGEQYNCTGGGTTTVTISGGQVVPADVTMWADLGYVFGAGQGYYTQPEAIGYADPSLHNEAAGLNNARFGYVNNATVTISDNAFIVGAVWGGSENGQVLGNCTVNVSGGQIGCGKGKTERYSESQWTAAKNAVTAYYDNPTDANATAIATIAAAMPECDSWPYDNPVVKNGKTYRFLPYDAYIHDDPLPEKEVNYASTHHAGDGHTFFGNVFGGGSGYYPYRITVEDQQGNDSTYSQWYEFQGRVRGNTTVNITGGHILTSIYGGCEYADVVGNCTVTMSGGTLGVPRTVAGIQAHPVTCYLFGAGKGDQRTTFNQRTNVQNTSVTVNSNAVIYGSVFGGGEDGHVKGNASVTIGGNAWIGTTGTSYYDGNIFGGGRGFGGTSISAGSIGGNVTVNISGSCKILGSVYGGGRLASVGTHFVDEDNERYGYLQGSYPGDTAQAQYHGNITLNISGGFIGNSDEFTHDRYNPSNSYSKGDIVYHNNHLWRFEAALAAGDPWDETKVTDIVHTTGGNVFGSSMGRLLNIGESDDDDADNFNPLWPGLAKCRNTQVNITDTARIYSSVYGGGELGYVMKDAKVDVNGADVTIGHSSGTGIEVAYFGSVYGGGFGSDNITIHDNDSASISGSVTAAMHAGRVYGNTDVKLQAGHVLGNIYGGGEMASVGRRWIDMALNGDELNYLPYNGAGNSSYTVNGTPHTTYGYSESVGNTKVTISGGTVGDFDNTTYNVNRYPGWIAGKKGGVFGGGKGRPGYYDVSEHISRDFHFTRMAYVDKAEVVISGGQMAAVFGGSENGHVRYDTKVTMTDGTVGIPLAIEEYDIDPYGYSPVTVYFGNLYGGGRGIDAVQGGHLGDGSGQVYGNTEVVISGGTVTHNVYGGGSIATVGTPLTEDDITRLADGTGETHVTIKGTAVIGDASARGHNSGRVFGSGRGVASEQFAARAYTHSTFVTIGSDNPGGDVCHVYGAVFGSGENGHVENHTHVYIKDGCEIGEHWAALEAPHNEYVGNVYGGGRGVDPNAGSISRTAGLVHGATHVQVTGGHIYHNIFGGGSLANVGDTLDLRGYATFRDTIEYTYHKAPLSAIGFDTSTNNGHAYIYISGGKIGIDGANNGSVFGGGRGNAGKSNYTPFIDPLPTAGFTSGSVTIGGNNYTTYHKTEDGKVISYRVTDEDEFGYDQDKTVWVLGKMRNSTSEPYEDSVVVRDYTNHTYVTGAHVLVNFPEVDDDSTTSYPVDRTTLYTKNGEGVMATYNTHLSTTATNTATEDYIRGCVFGGGDNGHVRGNTEVVVQQGRIGTLTANGNGNVFGGGRGEGLSYDGNYSIDAGKVYGNTNVTINNGWILHNVYGGGNLSSVGDFEVTLTGAPSGHEHDKDSWLNGDGTVSSYTTSGGTCTVTINGGTIGEKTSDIMANATTVRAGMDSRDANHGGNVFGSSRGQSSNATLVNRMAWTNFTNVTIDDDAVVNGSVFGGGENGHVFYTATVNIDGGSVGVNNTATSGDIYRGNVYGGGRGIDPVSGGNTFSRTSGLILGNTYVNMTDGTVYRNVFGGGSMASVGTYSYQNDGSADNDKITALQRAETGKTEVAISGGTVGINGANNGHVFGAGRGVAGLMGEQKMDNFTYVDRTYVTISGNANIAGCVFGSGDNGHVYHNTQVVVAGGTIGSSNGGPVNGNVFGSGRGADTYLSGEPAAPTLSPSAGRVYGNTDVYIVGGTMKNNIYGGGYLATVDKNTNVTINTSASVTRETYEITGGVPTAGTTTVTYSGTPTVYGDVFGGSALGQLGAVNCTTTVSIMGGTIGHASSYKTSYGNIFGGGNGDAEGNSMDSYSNGTTSGKRAANVLNLVKVNIGNSTSGNATILGNVFGGNNIAGSPKGDVYVDVYKTAHTANTNDFAALMAMTEGDDTVADLTAVAALLESATPADVTAGNAMFALKAVYGGGNQADYDPTDLAENVSHVTIHGCAENTIKYVYGGGRAASSNETDVVIEGGHIYQAFAGGDGSTGEPGANIGYLADGTTLHGSGNTSLTINGGAVYQAFGGSNTCGKIRGTSIVDISKTCDQLDIVEVFGGNNVAPSTGNRSITIKCGTRWNDVYGGANKAPITGNVTLNIVGGKMKRAFGGSKAATINGDVTVNVYGGSIGELYGGNNVSGNITGKITVNVDWTNENTCADAKSIDYVYGGGNMAAHTPNLVDSKVITSPVVNIINASVNKAVFGGGYGSTAIVTANPKVVIGADRVKNMAGSAITPVSNLPVTIGTDKNTLGATTDGDVFGGGNAAAVTGNTTVIVKGTRTTVWNNTYGGGNAAAVSGSTDVHIGAEPAE